MVLLWLLYVIIILRLHEKHFGVNSVNVFYSVIELAECTETQSDSQQQKLKLEKGISFPVDKSSDFQDLLSSCTLIFVMFC